MDNSNLDIWVAGALAAVTVDFLVYPMDTLKTRIQSPNYNQLYKDATTGAIKRDVLFRGLYQGVWSVVLATVPSFQNQTSKSQNPLPITHSLPKPIIHAISSSLAEMVSCAILTPAEVIKQNAQVLNMDASTNSSRSTSTPQQGTPRSATIQVLSKFKHRPWKLWSGYTALVGRNLPFTGLHFPIFEDVRRRLVSWREKKSGKSGSGTSVVERAILTAVAAGVSGTVASVVTTPIDVVKTRVMLHAAADSPVRVGEAAKRKVEGTFVVGREVWREEGVKGLFRGGALRSVWSAVGMSVYLGIYEGGRMYLENRRRRADCL
ncbi:mitochondrial carrier domain-containing protein [Aspergillus leporis]|uniref:Mitochondrial carrier domain-containing protein n=1 Tax=Aspergillus leporis TaxID=41062 RepID=A0A5N5X9K1_9EURO|nr:mitochondrial carrier domain-containing protein [Aspergillus leporis]